MVRVGPRNFHAIPRSNVGSASCMEPVDGRGCETSTKTDHEFGPLLIGFGSRLRNWEWSPEFLDVFAPKQEMFSISRFLTSSLLCLSLGTISLWAEDPSTPIHRALTATVT